MNIEEAKKLLSLHSGRCDEIENPKWKDGFLGSLRPFQGTLKKENFMEVMECLKVLNKEIASPAIDREIVSDIVGITHLARAWAAPDGMLGQNNLLTTEQTGQLLLWVDIIEECFMYLLEEDEEDAFWAYNEYLEGLLT